MQTVGNRRYDPPTQVDDIESSLPSHRAALSYQYPILSVSYLGLRLALVAARL